MAWRVFLLRDVLSSFINYHHYAFSNASKLGASELDDASSLSMIITSRVVAVSMHHHADVRWKSALYPTKSSTMQPRLWPVIIFSSTEYWRPVLPALFSLVEFVHDEKSGEMMKPRCLLFLQLRRSSKSAHTTSCRGKFIMVNCGSVSVDWSCTILSLYKFDSKNAFVGLLYGKTSSTTGHRVRP